MAVQIGGFILAGGGSSRMKRDKALLEVGGVPLLVRTARLLEPIVGAPSVVGDPATYESFALPVIADDWPGAGPLGGIATALRASTARWNLVVACDLPYLTREWLCFLLARAVASTADAVLPMNTLGAEPLCAMYHKRGEPAIRAALESGIRKVTDGLQHLRVETIPPAEWKAFDSEGLLFKNMNLPRDYQEAAARLDAPAKPGKK
ncbi:MAG TPA: molybdenum cofactor guanylyltransferase [Candidatus Acidoferrales bacterium]